MTRIRSAAKCSAARERALRAGAGELCADDDRRSRTSSGRSSRRVWHPNARMLTRGDATRSAHGEIHRAALQAARQAVLAMRANDEIGDDAFHRDRRGTGLARDGRWQEAGVKTRLERHPVRERPCKHRLTTLFLHQSALPQVKVAPFLPTYLAARSSAIGNALLHNLGKRPLPDALNVASGSRPNR